MKRLLAKVGTYTRDGQEKGKYAELGVLMDGDNGQYAMLHPYVNLQVVHQMQSAMNRKDGKDVRDSIMVSVFERDGQQQAQQPAQQAPEQQGGIDDDIPF